MIRMKGSGIRKISRVEEPPRKAVLLNAGEERVERPLGVPAFLKEKKGVRRVDPTSASGQDTRNRYGCCQGPTSDFMRAPRRVRRVTSHEGADKGQNSNEGVSPLRPLLSRLFGVRAAGLLHREVTANAGLVVFVMLE